jgi:short-subunit dehydrogenase
VAALIDHQQEKGARVSENVAIVTGASSGLGSELVRRLSEEGTTVVGVSRSPWQEGSFDRGRTVQVLGSVSHPDTVSRAFSSAEEAGNLTTVISCAGMGVFGEPGDYSREDVDDVLEGNLVGTILFSDRAFGQFKDQGEGTIVNVMSTAAHSARPLETIYTAAKWGARGYTDALRAAAKGTKLRVLGVYPGGMKTAFWDNSRGMGADTAGFADPEEIAEAIVEAIKLRDTSYTTDLLLNRI